MKAAIVIITLLTSCSATYVKQGDNVMISASLLTSQKKTITHESITEHETENHTGLLKAVFNWSFWKTLITTL